MGGRRRAPRGSEDYVNRSGMDQPRIVLPFGDTVSPGLGRNRSGSPGATDIARGLPLEFFGLDPVPR